MSRRVTRRSQSVVPFGVGSIVEFEDEALMAAGLDVWPDVIAYGVLLLPKGMKEDEKRPVVVCQHGLEGLPAHVVDADPKTEGFGYYKAFAARLAEEGFRVTRLHCLHLKWCVPALRATGARTARARRRSPSNGL